MKKTIKVFGIIVLTAIIGLSMAACEDSTEDGLTVTGISQYDGRWAIFNSAKEVLIGAESVSYANSAYTYKAVKISGGSVNLPIWEYDNATAKMLRYTESDTITDGKISIISDVTFDPEKDYAEKQLDLPSFTFKDGAATVTYTGN